MVELADGTLVPLSASPQGNEAWVLLLEKAFAKWVAAARVRLPAAQAAGGWQQGPAGSPHATPRQWDADACMLICQG